MELYKFDENNGLWYELHGDYYIPLLTLSPQEDKPIGIWGQRHLRYIRQNKRALYTSLKATGKLNNYIADVDEQAKDMFSHLVKQMAEKEGATEKLKAEDQMAWVGRMNNIRSRATEVIKADLIYA